MNKNVVLVFTTMALLLSCSREVDQVIQPGETITFTAGWAGAKDTRTILQPDGTSVWWEPSAQINVFFSDKASGKFTSTNSQAQGIVDFKGSLPIVVGSVETDNPAHAYWAVYPYDSANICDGESVTLTIPSIQTASEGTFANKMFPSIATSTNFYLAFYNICGGVRFTVANEGISSVTFKANNGESLVGKVQVGFDGVPVIKNVTAGSTEVTVNAPEGGFIPGKEYFASILPQTLSKGVSLTFKKANGTVASTSIDNAITVNRSRFGTMTEKDKGLVFQGEISVSSIELNQTSVRLREGETVTLVATVKPDNATDKTITWSSSDSNVATVDNTGVVKALMEGEITITAKAGDYKATCTVSVYSSSFVPNENYLSFTAIENSTLSYVNKPYYLEYSHDMEYWLSWGDFPLELSTGATVYVRGKGIWKGFRFKMTGKVSSSGNVMSLLYYDDFATQNEVSGNGFYQLFKDCKSLIKAPDLPATKLSPFCYEEMFYGCSSLTEAPELPATSIGGGCYKRMFQGCSSLIKAPSILPAMVLSTAYSSGNYYSCYYEMFMGCTSLEQAPVLPAMTLVSGCYDGMFRDCKSLKNAPELPATTLADLCYYNMFCGCDSLTTAPALPATKLEEGCYHSMFSLSGLVNAPELPATTLADFCYYNMFYGCDSLTTAPALPATKLEEGCYESMFNGSGLVNAPELPATTLANSCYENMFGFCRSLVNAPELPATTLASGCYCEMFNYCIELKEAPALPAQNLEKDCYNGMFSGCASLTKAPLISASSMSDNAERCCYGMFGGCDNLINGPDILSPKKLAKNCYEKMFAGCRSLEKAPELPATTLAEACYGNMFGFCINLKNAPSLPALILAEECYYEMFSSCTSLTSAPDLLSETLPIKCYNHMFSSCSQLNYIKMMAINMPNLNCLSGILDNTSKNGTFVKNAAATWEEDGIIPSGWTVITATE